MPTVAFALVIVRFASYDRWRLQRPIVVIPGTPGAPPRRLSILHYL